MLSPRALLLAVALAGAPVFARAQQSDWDAVRAAYGNLTHVAGTAFDRQVNSWNSSFEGANGTAVELSNPHMASADAAGNIYIADKESHSILKLTPAGKIHTAAGTHTGGYTADGPALTTPLYEPNGVFALADGTFYIVDLSITRTQDRIRRVGTDGMMTTIVPDTFLLGGRALWVSPDEQLIYFAGVDAASSPSLKRWTPAGGVQVVSSGFVSMGNITVDPNGAPVVTEDTGNRVFRIGPGGVKTLIAGTGASVGGGDGFPALETGLNRVRGVAFLPTGGYFLATQKGAHIWYVDTGGIIHKMMDCATSATPVFNNGNGENFSTPGIKMNEPRAITVAPNGDLLITASDHGQIRVVKCVRPPAPPARLSLEGFTAGPAVGRRLRWSGAPWQSYFIEHTPSLTPAAWQTIGLRTSEPGAETLHVVPPNGGAGEGFYRVRAPR